MLSLPRLCGFAALLIALDDAAADPPVFRAGASVVDVSPDKFPVIVNAMFEERSADKVADPLHARCLVLDDGTTRIAFTVVDTCMMPRDLIDRAKELASKEAGIPVERMLVSATHTHSAPAAMGCLGSRADPDYAAALPAKIARGIIEATKQLEPARVGWASVDDWEHTFNRRWIRRPDRMLTDPFGVKNVRAHMHPGHESKDVTGPSGPVDPQLSVLAVQTRNGKPLALLANYSQHYYGSPLLSSDYYGRFAKHIAQQLGADEQFVAMMSQGTSGDLMWMDYSAPRKEIGYDAYAAEVATRAAEAYRKIEWKESAPLAMAERKMTLGFRLPDEQRLASGRAVMERLKGVPPRSQPEIYALESVYLHERPTAELKLQAVRIGELGMAAIPNEVFALTGLKIKAQSPFASTFNIELANGAEGYIPPAEQHKLGGYTTWPARTAGLVPEAEPKIVETVLGLLEEVAGKPRRPMKDEHGAYAQAVLGAKPVAYWRLNDPVSPTALDTMGNHPAALEDGVALWLPGADEGQGIKAVRPPVPNAFSGAQINRAVHFAGGRMRAEAPELKATYSVELWLWNGLPNDARDVTGYVFSRGPDGDKQCPGDHLGIGGVWKPELTGKLIFFNGNARDEVLGGRTTLAWREWHHVLLVREGKKVTVFLNGNAEPEIAGGCEPTVPAGTQPLFIGGRSDNVFNFEGKLDEVAIYDRALTATDAAAHYKASGLPAKAVAAMPAPASGALSPEESLKKLHVRTGFRAELVAAEPLVLDPVAIDWDGAGRMWVVEMADYPLGMDNKGTAGGRIRVLEDTDGDGRFDKSTLFAEGLQMPNGLLTWRDGVLVTTAPDILFLKDTDGDGKADVREVLYTGFLVGNPQLRVNGLRWGLDNWIYCGAGGHHGQHGIGTKIKSTRTGKETIVGSRDVRIRPDTGEIEPQSGPTQFGRNRDEWGHWFGTQNSWPLWHYVLADHYLRRNPHVAPPDPVVQLTTKNPKVFPASSQEKRYHSFEEGGHFTSACAGMIYSDELLFSRGETVHGFTCEPFHNLVHHLVVAENGVSFTAARAPEEKESEFLASEDRWFRPVMTRTGPDGALWVVDMYRYMIEHPEWLPANGKAELLPHYREGEDKGRIYRVFPANAAPRKPAKLDKLSLAELVAALESPNAWQRDKVQQMLLWRATPVGHPERNGGGPAGGAQSKDPVPSLATLAQKSPNPHARLQALCTLDGLDSLKPEMLERALADEHAGVRENALRLAETRGTPEVIAAAVKLGHDRTPKVRLQLASSLGQWKGAVAGEALGRIAVVSYSEPYVTAAVMSSAVPHLRALCDAVARAGAEAAGILTEPLLAVALAVGDREAIGQLIAPVFTGSTALVAPAPARGDAKGAQAASFALPEIAAFGRFVEALERRKSSLAELTKIDDALSAKLRAAPQVFAAAKKLANDAARAPLERVSAAAALTRDSASRAEALPLLATFLTPQAVPEAQSAAIRALASTGDDAVPSLLTRGWPSHVPAVRTVIIDELLGREKWAAALLGQIERKEIAATALDAVRRERLTKHPNAEVRATAARVLTGAPSADRAAVLAQFQPALALKGDAAKGEAIFAQRCASCHKRGNVGQDIGPDLRSVTAHEPARLLAAILDPSADVQPGFHVYQCRLGSGEEVYGIITAETATSIALKLPDATTRTVLRSDIAALQSSNQSLMPAGLEAGLTPQEMADLIALLRTP